MRLSVRPWAASPKRSCIPIRADKLRPGCDEVHVFLFACPLPAFAFCPYVALPLCPFVPLCLCLGLVLCLLPHVFAVAFSVALSAAGCDCIHAHRYRHVSFRRYFRSLHGAFDGSFGRNGCPQPWLEDACFASLQRELPKSWCQRELTLASAHQLRLCGGDTCHTSTSQENVELDTCCERAIDRVAVRCNELCLRCVPFAVFLQVERSFSGLVRSPAGPRCERVAWLEEYLADRPLPPQVRVWPLPL